MDDFGHIAEIEVSFNNKNYDYMIGNSNFYIILGDRRYTTFDRVISNGSLQTLKKVISERSYGKPFFLKFRAVDDKIYEMICRIEEQDDPDRTLIRMWKLEDVIEKYLLSEKERRETNALLSQHDCVYYSYDRPTNTMTCYRYDGEKIKLCELELEVFTQKSKTRLPESSHGEVDKFADKLKNGIRSFTGSFFHSDEETIVFAGTAIYDYDIHSKTVGSFGSGSANPLRELVRKDQLTGLALKEDITNYAKRVIGEPNSQTFISIIDIDDFKYVNDHHGHATGDAVLKKCASIIENEVGMYGKAGRIGGDEFFVVFDNIRDDGKDTLRNVLRSIKNNIGSAYSNEKDGFRVTTSIGVAAYPQDAEDFDALFRLTDYMLYRAKHKGKNRYIIYDAEKHGPVEEILRSSIETTGITGRKGISKAEVVCRIADLVVSGKEYPADNIIRDIVDHFGVERVILYDKEARTAVAQCGSKLLDGSVIAETVDYIFDEGIQEHSQNGVMIVNNIKTFEARNPELYEKLSRQNICSIMHREITAKNGKHFVLSCESVSTNVTWNLEDLRFYRILDKIMASVL